MKTLIQKDTSVLKFTAALFATAKMWKQPKCPTRERTKKMECMHTLDYYLAIKRKEFCNL